MGPRYRAPGSFEKPVDGEPRGSYLEGVLGDDFVGLVPAWSDTHEPEHLRRRENARARADAARVIVGEPRVVAIASP